MAFVLRLNREDEIDYDSLSYSIFTRRQNVEIARRLWWTLVVADQMERRFGGECLSIRDEDCRSCLSTDDDIAWASDSSNSKWGLWVVPRSSAAQKQIAALSSTAPFYPCFEASGTTSAVLQLCKIDRRIFMFQKKESVSNLTERQLTQELQQIFASLESLHQKVDPSLTLALDLTVPPTCPEERRAYWKRLFYHIFYQSLFQDLCRSEINGCPPTGSHIQMRDTPVFQRISASADISSIIIHKFLEHNAKLAFVPPLISYMIFSNGMVHLLGTKFNTQDSVFVAHKTKCLN